MTSLAPNTETKPQGFRFVTLSFLGITNGFNVIFNMSLGILLPAISSDLTLSPTEQGWLGSSALLGNLMFSLPASILLSRLNGRLVLLGALITMASFALGQAWAPWFVLLLLARLFFGLAVVSMHPARTILLKQWFPSREIILANGVFNSTYGPSALVALILTPYLLFWINDSWRTILTIYGIAIFAVAVCWATIGRDPNVSPADSLTGEKWLSLLKSLGQSKTLWYLGGGLFGMNVMWGAFITFWPTFLLDNHNIALTTSGAIFSVAAMLEAIGSLMVGYYMAKWAKRDLMGPLITLLGTMLVIGAAGMVLTDSLTLLIVFAVIHGIGFSLVPFLWTFPFQIPNFGPREIAVAIGFIETCMQVGGMVGPALTGLIQHATNNLQLGLLICTAFSGAIVVAGLLIMISKPRDLSNGTAKLVSR